MSRFLLLALLLCVIGVGCEQRTPPHLTATLPTRYVLYVNPAFQDALSIEILPLAQRIRVQRYISRYVADSVGQDGKTLELMDSIRFEKIRSLLKPAFVVELPLTSAEVVAMVQALQEAAHHSVRQRAGYNHATSFSLDLIEADDSTHYFLGTPKVQSTTGHTLAAFLEQVESKYVEQALVVEAIEHSTFQFRKQAFKVLHTDPLYIRLIMPPPPLDNRHWDSLVQQLPVADEVYLDLTHYQGRDTEDMAELFRKRYKHLRWIYTDAACVERRKIFNRR